MVAPWLCPNFKMKISLVTIFSACQQRRCSDGTAAGWATVSLAIGFPTSTLHTQQHIVPRPYKCAHMLMHLWPYAYTKTHTHGHVRKNTRWERQIEGDICSSTCSQSAAACWCHVTHSYTHIHMSIYPWQQLLALHKHVDMIKYVIVLSHKTQYFFVLHNFNLHGTGAVPEITDWHSPCSVEELQSADALQAKKMHLFLMSFLLTFQKPLLWKKYLLINRHNACFTSR